MRDYAGTIAGILAIVIATIAIIVTIVITGNLGDRLTPLEQAPCRLNPGSKLCRQSIDGILKTISPRQAHDLQVKAAQYRK